MMCMLFWTCFTVLTLNVFTLDVECEDGLSIHLQGWPERLWEYCGQ